MKRGRREGAVTRGGHEMAESDVVSDAQPETVTRFVKYNLAQL